MRMRNVGPKNITRSLLEDKPRKKKHLMLSDGAKSDKPSKSMSFKVLASKNPEDLTPEEKRALKKKRIERRKKRDLEAMQQAETNDKRFDKGLTRGEKNLARKEKKLSASRALIVSTGANLTPKERRELAKQTESYFGANSSKIMDLLENGDADSGITVLKKTLLMTIIRVLPMAEQILTDSGTAKGTYQFVTLISQMRELMADIQADRDKQFIAQSITEQIIRPAFMNMAQEMLTQHHSFRKQGDLFVASDKSKYFSEQLMNLGKDLATKMQLEYREVESKIVEALKN